MTLDGRLALCQQLKLWASYQLVLTCCWAILKFRAQQPKSPRLINPPSRPLYGWPQLWISFFFNCVAIADKKPDPFAARKGVIKLNILVVGGDGRMIMRVWIWKERIGLVKWEGRREEVCGCDFQRNLHVCWKTEEQKIHKILGRGF